MQTDKLFLPDAFQCPIFQTLMQDPVLISDGHTFQRKAIQEWFKRGNNTNPLTGLPLQQLHLIPNLALKDVIEELLPWIETQEKQRQDLEHTLKELEKMWQSDIKKIRKCSTEKGQKQEEEMEETKEEKQVQKSLKQSLQLQMNAYLKEFTQWENGLMSFQKKVEILSTAGRYLGQVKNGRQHGKGIFFYEDPRTKIPRASRILGLPLCEYNGHKFIGEFKNGVRDGQGIVFKKGVKFFGTWKNDKIDGVALQVLKGQSFFQIWEEGNLVEKFEV